MKSILYQINEVGDGLYVVEEWNDDRAVVEDGLNHEEGVFV